MKFNRIELAEAVLDASFGDLLDQNGLGGRYFSSLPPYAPLDSQLSTAERIFLEGLRVSASRNLDATSGLRTLLALMLFSGQHRIRVNIDWRSLPVEFSLRLLRAHLRFLPYFEFDDDAALNIEHLRRLCAEILANYERTPDENSFRLLDLMARELNLMLTYFSTVELREINELRGRLLDTWLRACGCRLDWDCPVRVSGAPIRIGFIAQSFLAKTETFYTLPVFRHLDRDRFSAHLFAFAKANDAAERLCIRHADSFEILPQGIAEAASRVREARIDVLFYVSNLLAWSSPSVLLACHRLARIQVTTGLSPATTGLKFMDRYFVGTQFKLEPACYTESLAWIDGLGLCLDRESMQPENGASLSREQLGIPEKAVAFVSGANVYKMNPELIRAWCRVIREVPDSVLVLYPFGPNWSSNYAAEEFVGFLGRIASSCGVDPGRIKIATIQGGAMVHALLQNCDVYLDSIPYGGTTSAVDALEAGLPVVSLMGPTFREQMTGRLLVDLGFPDYACEALGDYTALATRLGQEAEFRRLAARAFSAAYASNPALLDSRTFGSKMAGAMTDLLAD